MSYVVCGTCLWSVSVACPSHKFLFKMLWHKTYGENVHTFFREMGLVTFALWNRY